MSETYKEQVRRVQMMAEGNPTWDLSDNDTAALTSVLEQLVAYAMEVAELRKDKARLDEITLGPLTVEHRHGLPAEMRWLVRKGTRHLASASDLREAIDAAIEAK